jgi:hypothetical protein
LPRPNFHPQGNPFYQPPHTPEPANGGLQNLRPSLGVMITTPQNHGSPPKTAPSGPAATHHPSLRKDPARVVKLLDDMTRQTDGYTVEQLEQVYAVCMDVIWRLRHEWDRTVVIKETETCVWRVMNEIEVMKRERQKDLLDIEH